MTGKETPSKYSKSAGWQRSCGCLLIKTSRSSLQLAALLVSRQNFSCSTVSTAWALLQEIRLVLITPMSVCGCSKTVMSRASDYRTKKTSTCLLLTGTAYRHRSTAASKTQPGKTRPRLPLKFTKLSQERHHRLLAGETHSARHLHRPRRQCETALLQPCKTCWIASMPLNPTKLIDDATNTSLLQLKRKCNIKT